MKIAWAVISISLVASLARAEPGATYMPKEGYVPDAATAIRIAEAIWIPIYGAKQIESEKPFRATLQKGTWTVTGTLPKDMLGGTPLAEIAKSDGRVLRVIHGK